MPSSDLRAACNSLLCRALDNPKTTLSGLGAAISIFLPDHRVEVIGFFAAIGLIFSADSK